ncbi:MAG: tRNA (adenosine(37)-N6)-dimethylallyltransferase MiaA [Acidobacteria bacterium]|nr:tRNA (adenosine(37)-N6)-dimethylallyltransferase MiaA [Acidobacteriota bacterium]
MHPTAARSNPLIAIVGPTGSGKSDLALRLAHSLDGEIVNCDSVQLYRRFDIGSAKVPMAARQGVAHHLIDVLDPDEVCSAGEYARMARPVLEAVTAKGRVPLVVGGTGFYLRALIDGLAEAPPAQEGLRARLREARAGAAWRLLRRLDAAGARSIHPNDHQKAMRAIELVLHARSLDGAFARDRNALAGYRTLYIGLAPERQDLDERIRQRTAAMFESGLCEEVRGILRLGYSRDAKPFESVGYKQALAVVEGRLTLEAAVEETRLRTRQYAKRQSTWFRAQHPVAWLEGFGHDGAVIEKATAMALEFVRAASDGEALRG